MSDTNSTIDQNVRAAESRFLNSLPSDILTSLKPDLEPVELARGDYLMRAGEAVEYVYFPTSCLISLIVVLESGNTIEAATVGNDGFAGISAFLGIEQSDLTAIVQMEGEALRMSLPAFQRHLGVAGFRERLGAYAAKTLATVSQSVACIAFHPVHERLARWLLLVRDGTERDEFTLTQEFLATMLGVHRPTVTIAIRFLESAELIEHRRGMIRIVDVDALTEASCECYRLSSWVREHF